MSEGKSPPPVIRDAETLPPAGELIVRNPSPRDILVDALAAVLLVLSAFAVEWVERFAFGGNTPWAVAAMLFVSELTLFIAFVNALLSALSKVRQLAAQSGVASLVRGLVALRPDRALLTVVGRVFRNAAAVGAGLGVFCGAIALAILLIADAGPDVRERWFFYGLYSVVGGTIGVLLFIPVDRAIMKDIEGSACTFGVMFFVVVFGGLLIWLGLGLGEVEQRLTLLRTMIGWLAPELTGT